jgi:hypothetical protein
MGILKPILYLIAALTAGVIVLFAFLAFAFRNDGKPIISVTSEILSPDKKWMVTEELIDNGLGFGQGMLYDEIHIRHPEDKISNHGKSDSSVVFYLDAMGDDGKAPKIEWIDSNHLKISYEDLRHSKGSKPGKSVTDFNGIVIEYKNI